MNTQINFAPNAGAGAPTPTKPGLGRCTLANTQKYI